MEKVKGWKTVAFGAIVAVAGFLEGAEITSVISQYPAYVGSITGFVIMGLRFITTSSIFSK